MEIITTFIMNNFGNIIKVSGTIKGIFTSLKFVFNILSKERVSEDYFENHLQKIFLNISNFLIKLNVISKSKIINEKNTLIAYIKKQTKNEKGIYYFSTEAIEDIMLKKYLNKKVKVHKFIRFVYFYSNSNSKILTLTLFIEQIKSKLWFKETFYHFLSIPNWNNLDINELQSKVKTIKIVKAELLHIYDFKNSNIDVTEKNSKISKVISKVLKDGFISEDTIRALSSRQKLLIIHKYSEGFTDIFTEDRNKIEELKKTVYKYEDEEDIDSQKKVEKALKEIQKIQAKRIRTPVAVALEKSGFIKLFRNMTGVYVIPLWKLPSDYQKNPNLYIEKVVLKIAKDEIEKLKKKDQRISQLKGDLRYVILYHIVDVGDLKVMEKERELSISSPILSKNLLASFFREGNNKLSSIYIDNIFQNVSIWSFMSKESKTGKYLFMNKDMFELLLLEYNVNPSLPISLINLSDSDIKSISERIILKNKLIRKQDIQAIIKKQRAFYLDLKNEISSIKSKHGA